MFGCVYIENYKGYQTLNEPALIPILVLFAAWSIVFNELWLRKEASIKAKWGLPDQGENAELKRYYVTCYVIIGICSKKFIF